MYKKPFFFIFKVVIDRLQSSCLNTFAESHQSQQMMLMKKHCSVSHSLILTQYRCQEPHSKVLIIDNAAIDFVE
jgi:hypothetical protein